MNKEQSTSCSLLNIQEFALCHKRLQLFNKIYFDTPQTLVFQSTPWTRQTMHKYSRQMLYQVSYGYYWLRTEKWKVLIEKYNFLSYQCINVLFNKCFSFLDSLTNTLRELLRKTYILNMIWAKMDFPTKSRPTRSRTLNVASPLDRYVSISRCISESIKLANRKPWSESINGRKSSIIIQQTNILPQMCEYKFELPKLLFMLTCF